jgi:DNA-binding GntR family transcriptional regulator
LTKPIRAKANKLGEVERVYRVLREWLITAKLPPGEFLSEADLAERCTRLMQDHWLTRIRRKGFMVTPISVRDIVDMYDYRKLLECYAAEKLAQSASLDQLKELAAIVAPEKDPAATLEQILVANQAFHRRLSELAGNQRVTSQLSLTLGYVARLDTLCTQTVPGWIGHADILRAIERREPVEARLAMQVHVDASRDKMIKLFSA